MRTINECLFTSNHKLFKRRIPRKLKKRYKNMMANRLGLKPSKLKFRYNGVFNRKK